MVNIQFCLSSGGYNPCDTYSNKQLLITRAEVVLLKPESNKTCNFWSGDYMSFRNTLYSYTSSDILHREGSFGYYGRYLWMDLGCKAEYRICVLGKFCYSKTILIKSDEMGFLHIHFRSY